MAGDWAAASLDDLVEDIIDRRGMTLVTEQTWRQIQADLERHGNRLGQLMDTAARESQALARNLEQKEIG